MALRFLLPALAVAGIVSAQSSNSCSTSATATIQNQGDASGLAGCATFSGSIAVATGTSENINLPNVRLITGDLIVRRAPNITQLGADSLVRIGGDFRLDDCQLLSTVTFPFLNQVSDLIFNALPNLQRLGFSSNIKTADTLNIQNTFLTSLDGINLQKVGSIYIANNRLLQEVSFQVSNISDSLTIESNGDRLTANFPNLMSAQNLTFRNVPSVSIPSLAKVQGSLGFYENTFSSIFTPNLTGVLGTLAFVANNQLTNITMPKLTTLGGGLQVQNNSQLTDLSNSFPSVQTIGGALDFFGAFTSVKLPALKDNRGAFNLQSSADIDADCATFKAQSGPNSVIKGKFTCGGNQTTPRGAGTTPTTGSSGAKSTKTSEAGRLDLSANAALGIGGVIAAMFGLL